MKSKLVLALLILGTVWWGMGILAAQGTAPSLAGSWQLTLTSSHPSLP